MDHTQVLNEVQAGWLPISPSLSWSLNLEAGAGDKYKWGSQLVPAVFGTAHKVLLLPLKAFSWWTGSERDGKRSKTHSQTHRSEEWIWVTVCRVCLGVFVWVSFFIYFFWFFWNCSTVLQHHCKLNCGSIIHCLYWFLSFSLFCLLSPFHPSLRLVFVFILSSTALSLPASLLFHLSVSYLPHLLPLLLHPPPPILIDKCDGVHLLSLTFNS